jgi:hypothetical protein
MFPARLLGCCNKHATIESAKPQAQERKRARWGDNLRVGVEPPGHERWRHRYEVGPAHAAKFWDTLPYPDQSAEKGVGLALPGCLSFVCVRSCGLLSWLWRPQQLPAPSSTTASWRTTATLLALFYLANSSENQNCREKSRSTLEFLGIFILQSMLNFLLWILPLEAPLV